MPETDPLIANSTPISKTKFRIILATLWFGTFLAAADSTIVSTLLAQIASDLQVLDSISWVATAYLVAYSAFQPVYGKLSDIFGRQRVLLVSTFVFALGCQVCALSNSIGVLIAGRLLNGVGAGGMLGMSVITVSDFVPGRQRGVYQGFGNLVYAAGAASGGAIGGLAQSYRGWRFAFSLQVPMCVLSMVIVSINMRDLKPRTVKPSERSPYERIDFVGSWSLALFVCLVMFATSTGGNQFAWFSWQISTMLVSAVAIFYLFIYWETHKAVEPVLPVSLLTNRTILSNCINLFFSSGISYSYLFYGPIYFASVLDYSPTKVSRRLLANFIGGSCGSLGAGYIMRETGKYYKLGLASTGGLLISGFLWLAMPLLPPSYTDNFWWQDAAYALQGLSYYSILTVVLVSMIAAVPEHQSTGTSAQYTFRGTGSSIILAGSGAIFSNVLKHQLAKNITGKHAHSIIEKVAKSVDAIRQAPLEYQNAIISCYRTASAVVFATVVGLSILAFIASSFTQEFELDNGEE